MSTTKKPDLFTAAENVICLLHLQAVLRGWGALLAVLHPQHTQRHWEEEEGRKRGQKAVDAPPNLGTEAMKNWALCEGKQPTACLQSNVLGWQKATL